MRGVYREGHNAQRGGYQAGRLPPALGAQRRRSQAQGLWTPHAPQAARAAG